MLEPTLLFIGYLLALLGAIVAAVAFPPGKGRFGLFVLAAGMFVLMVVAARRLSGTL
jgi:hypothetical protein